MSPAINLSIPSIMLETDNLQSLYNHLKETGVTVGEIVDLPQGKVFNFSDPEENYFAVIENKI